MEVNEIKDLAKRIMFEVSDEEANKIKKAFEIFDKQVAVLNEIDTENVEEMIYPFDVETTYLREDEVKHLLSKEDALANVSKVKEGHVVVPKVVK